MPFRLGMNDESGNGATPRQRYRSRLVQAVLTTLAEQENGSLPVKELFDELVERLQLGPEELVPIAGGPERKFERDAYFGLIAATKAGWLKRQGGVWTLTAEGREAIGKYTDAGSLQKAARALYQEWRRSRPAKAQPAPRAAFDRSDPETARAILEAMNGLTILQYRMFLDSPAYCLSDGETGILGLYFFNCLH